MYLKNAFSAFSCGFFFPENCGVLSEERGERFHRDVSEMEKIYRESGLHRY
jgi:hypothetical protein